MSAKHALKQRQRRERWLRERREKLERDKLRKKLLAQVVDDLNGYSIEPEHGPDPHQILADAMGVNRATAKDYNFGQIYGMKPKALAQHQLVEPDRAKAFVLEYKSNFNGMDFGQLEARTLAVVEKRGKLCELVPLDIESLPSRPTRGDGSKKSF